MSRFRTSIIVVNWNTRALLARCLASIRETAGNLVTETLVVDNGSTDGSAAMVAEEFPEVRLLGQSENLGFSRAVNRALSAASGELILLLNSDTVLLPGSLEAAVEAMDRDPGIDALGCRLVGEDGTVQSSCGMFPGLRSLFWQNVFVLTLRVGGKRPVRFLSRFSGVPLMPLRDLMELWDSGGTRDVDWVSGAFLLTRRSVLDHVGEMDEAFWLFGEDMDWCWRVALSGGRTVYFGGAEIVHVGGGSTVVKVESDLRHYRASLRLYAKHRGRWQTAVYRTLLGTAALGRLVGLVLAHSVGRARPEFRSRAAREWGLITLR
jgi:GT2 family glycosyltransferase